MKLEKRLEITFEVRMLHVLVGALKFEAVANKERSKAWHSV